MCLHLYRSLPSTGAAGTTGFEGYGSGFGVALDQKRQGIGTQMQIFSALSSLEDLLFGSLFFHKGGDLQSGTQSGFGEGGGGGGGGGFARTRDPPLSGLSGL